MVADRVPLRRVGQPEEVAATVMFLLSDTSSYITDDRLRMHGGWLA